jgi:hypothetical protein
LPWIAKEYNFFKDQFENIIEMFIPNMIIS